MLLEQQIILIDGVGLIYGPQASKGVQKGHCAPLKIKIHILLMEMLNRYLLSQKKIIVVTTRAMMVAY